MKEIENFDSWDSKKKDIHSNKNRIPFRQGEIWFVHIGQNVGYEVYGKGKEFLKPVIVFRKINRNTFLAIPLTSKIKDDKFHCVIEFRDKQNSAILTHIKTIDAKRLRYKIGNIDKKIFKKLEIKFVNFYKLTPQDRGEATLTKSEQRINGDIIPNETKEVK
jgi:mRNA-degrading endonuclease toxin of MazEF toxin-antitoxin module